MMIFHSIQKMIWIIYIGIWQKNGINGDFLEIRLEIIRIKPFKKGAHWDRISIILLTHEIRIRSTMVFIKWFGKVVSWEVRKDLLVFIEPVRFIIICYEWSI